MTRIRISPDPDYHGSIPGPLHYSDGEIAESWAGDDDLSVLIWLAARETTRLCRRLLHLAWTRP